MSYVFDTFTTTDELRTAFYTHLKFCDMENEQYAIAIRNELAKRYADELLSYDNPQPDNPGNSPGNTDRESSAYNRGYRDGYKFCLNNVRISLAEFITDKLS